MSNAFDDVRLPEYIEQGSEGGPGFQTTINTLSTGYEQRNQDWPSQRCEYDISYGIQERADWKVVVAFFYARAGKARAFRFKDWSDYSSDGPQQIGVGNGVNRTFQLVKNYTSSVVYTRKITRPVAGTIKIYVNGVLQTSGVTINTATGLVTFAVAPVASPSTLITAEYEFDVPVRFDVDKLKLNMKTATAVSVDSITIVEVRE